MKKKYKCIHCKYEEKMESHNNKYCEVICYPCPKCSSGRMILKEDCD
jgi:hypothetical protein